MATTKKKVTTKKAAPKKTTTVKAAAAKKAPVKKTVAARKTTVKHAAAKKAGMRSFHVSKDQAQFTTFRITRQTVYWVILVAFIIFAQLWILKLQVEVATLIDAQQAQIQNF